MKRVLNGVSLVCIGIGAVLTVIILILGQQTRLSDLFILLIVVNGIGFVSLLTVLIAERGSLLRRVRASTLLKRIAGMLSQLVTAMTATIFGTTAAIFIPPLLVAVILSVRWFGRKIVRAWRRAWWRNRSLQ